MSSKKGFTLIEMLIVVAIIGILAGAVLVGLGPVQKSGRDARRLSDLRNVQTALELYYNANGSYPDPGGATLLSGIMGSLTGVASGQIPKDPRNIAPFVYYYTSATPFSKYVIGAALEDVAANNANKGSVVGGTTFNGTSCGSNSADNTYFMFCISL